MGRLSLFDLSFLQTKIGQLQVLQKKSIIFAKLATCHPSTPMQPFISTLTDKIEKITTATNLSSSPS